MVKRRGDEVQDPRTAKTRKIQKGVDRLSLLTDELLLRVLSHLSVYTLTVCQAVSARLNNVAGDSQLWKSAYYDRFVRPRANRLPGIRSQSHAPLTLAPQSRLSRWLDEDHLVQGGKETDWKRQYKLRHNWTRGQCGITEIPVGETPPAASLLARLHNGVVYTVDASQGLRAFAYKDEQKMLAHTALEAEAGADKAAPPSAVALDLSQASGNDQTIAIGFRDGSFALYAFDLAEKRFDLVYRHAASSNGVVSAIAFAGAYVCTVSKSQAFSLYRYEDDGGKGKKKERSLSLMTSLSSSTIWPPVSVSLRLGVDRIIASIAYAFHTYTAGWSAGVQEIHIWPDGTVDQSRLATAHNHGLSSLAGRGGPTAIGSKPTSLSYSHPYLLFCHADNTLTLYLVNSSGESLSIGRGKRLWGHTSSVFGAHVGGRGRAVSVTTRGEEVRVWELEGSTLISTSQARRRRAPDSSVQVTPEKRRAQEYATEVCESPCAKEDMLSQHESSITKGWVGFDEENVIVLREKGMGGQASQALAVYDFT